MRALISVYDKSGVVEFARGLGELGFEIVSSGGTGVALGEAGIAVTKVEDVTDAGLDPVALGKPCFQLLRVRGTLDDHKLGHAKTTVPVHAAGFYF